MSYSLEPGEDPREGLRRIAREQIEKAIAALDASSPDREELNEAVHDARKHFKKVRALLRLFRHADEDVYKRENKCFRNMGRELAPFRDGWLLVTLTETLTEEDGSFLKLRDRLHQEYEKSIEDAGGDLKKIRQKMVRDLKNSLKRVDDWPLKQKKFGLMKSGLKQVYQEARGGLRLCLADPSTPKLHDWRKRVKYLRYQLNILEEVWPAWTAATLKELHLLTNALGDFHDLALLEETVRDRFQDELPEDRLQAFRETIDRRHLEQTSQAWPLARRLFAETPAAFVGRVESYWEVAWAEED